MLAQEFFGGSCPFGETHCVYSFSIRAQTQIEILVVCEEVGTLFVKLRNQLFDITWICETTLPLFVNAFEQTVRVVELATLKLDHPLWMLTNQKPNNVPGATVVSSVQVAIFFRQLVVP